MRESIWMTVKMVILVIRKTKTPLVIVFQFEGFYVLFIIMGCFGLDHIPYPYGKWLSSFEIDLFYSLSF
jgi:hypothetical protein